MHNDVDVLFPVWLLVGTFALMIIVLLWACGTAFSLLYLVENRAWLVMFLRKLYRPLSFQAKVRWGSRKVSSFGALEQETGGECGWGS